MNYQTLAKIFFITASVIALGGTLGQAEYCYHCSHPIWFEILSGVTEPCINQHDQSHSQQSPLYCSYGCRVTRTFDAGQMKATIQRGCSDVYPSQCPNYVTFEGKSLHFNICCSGDYCNSKKYELGIIIAIAIVCLTIVFQILYNIFIKTIYLLLFLVVCLTIICYLLYAFL